MDKILVMWSEGRSKGTTSLVKKTAVKQGTIAAGREVLVSWGKAKKTHKAKVVDVNEIVSPEVPHQGRGTSADDADIQFELASAAMVMNSPEHAQNTQPSQVSQPPDQQLGEMLSALSEKMEKLSDTISRIEAQMLCRLDAVEEKLEVMQEDLKKGTLPPEAFLNAPPVHQMQMPTPTSSPMPTPGV